MTKKIILYLSAILFLMRCTPKKVSKPDIAEFSTTKEIKWETIGEIESLAQPYKIMVEDSLLVVANTEGEYFFQVYTKDSLHLLAEFGDRGRGPGEFNEPELTGQVINRGNKRYHLVYDWKTRQISFVNFQDYTIDYKEKKLPNSMDALGLIYYSDSLVIASAGMDASGRFVIKKGDKQKIIDYLPQPDFEVNENNLHFIFANGGWLSNKYRKIFVATPNLLGQYDFFNFQGDYLYSVIIDKDEELEKAALSKNFFEYQVTHYGFELSSTDEYIYALYLRADNQFNLSKSEIHILNWEGEALVRYRTDKSIISLAVDKEKHVFYGLAYDQDTYRFSIVKYEYQPSDWL